LILIYPYLKNVNQDVEELDVTLIHMDYLSQLTDETLENRKKHIPAAEAIIEEIKEDNVWTKGENLHLPFMH
jgi:glutamyl-tRNA reductase